jgi:heme-degrading monooxygenase HmoA
VQGGSTVAIAHFNVARLLHPPGDPRVAEFTTNTERVNLVAERSPGYIWRWTDEASTVEGSGGYQAVEADPSLAISLSVWDSVAAFRFFVQKTVHGAFLRRREEWFAPWGGPNYVIWPLMDDEVPTVAEGWARLDKLTRGGPTAEAYDLHWAGIAGQA